MTKPMMSLAAGVSAVAIAFAAPADAQGSQPAPPPAVSPQSATPVTLAPSAQGPGTPKASDTSGANLSDIVVYAQKKARGEQLQNVPIAVTAVDSKLIEAAHMIDIRDIGRLVPNASLDGVGTFPGFANFFMRGVGVSTSVRSIDPAVNIVQDGMVIGYQAGAILDTFDTESVEVLRGPQGVLFGRNASGGVVNLRSKRPTGAFGGQFQLTLGNAGTVETRSAVEGTVVPDKVFTRVAILKRDNNGFIHNTNSGTFVSVASNPNPTGATAAAHATGRVGETNEIVVKNTWVFKPAAGTTFTLLGQYLNFDDGGGTTRAFNVPGIVTGEQSSWGWTPDNSKWDVNMTTPGYTKIKGWHLIGELTQAIGSGTLTAVGAYRKIGYRSTLNVSGDPFDTILFPDGDEHAKQASLEARYNVSLGDRFDLLLGGFYFDLDENVTERRIIRVATSTLKSYRLNIWDQKTRSYAGFANIDFRPTDKLTLSAGVRYSHDRKSMHILPLQVCPGQSFNCAPVYLDSAKSWHDLSPRFVANYKATRDVMLYASYSKGYRAGNYNARAVTAGGAVTPANPETVGSLEAGVKSEWLQHRVRINLGVYREKYNDIQRLVQFTIPGESPAQALFNAAKATIQGVELETSFVPFRGLRLDANVGLTHAKYAQFNNLTGLLPGQSVTDLQFDRVPKWTGYVGGTYETRIGDSNNRLSFNLGYTWRSHVYTDVLNTAPLQQNAYGLLNGSVSYRTGPWNLSLFGRNMLDKEYAEIKSRNTGFNAFGGSPRYYGVEAGFRF